MARVFSDISFFVFKLLLAAFLFSFWFLVIGYWSLVGGAIVGGLGAFFLLLIMFSRHNAECKHPTCGDTCRRPKAEKKTNTLKRNSIKKKPHQIKPFSKKREKANKIYSMLRKPFLEARPVCEIQSPVCTYQATCVHHVKGRGKYLLEVSTWKASCEPCNGYVEVHDEWARENGHKLSKFY